MSVSRVVAIAEKFLGVPYVWGGTTRHGIDCSGLVWRAYHRLGRDLPRTAAQMQSAAHSVGSLKDAQPGDLLFFGQPAYHVAIYLGHGKLIESPQPGETVHVTSIYQQPTSIGRFSYAGEQTVPGSGMGHDAGSPVGHTGLTGADYQRRAGDLGAALTHIPELRQLLHQAEKQDWAPGKFENAVQGSDWYQTHSATARSVIAQKFSDPATYQQQVNQGRRAVREIADQNGWDLSHHQVHAIANYAMLSGNTADQNWLTAAIGRKQDYTGLHSTDNLQGGMAATVDQLQQLAAQYGVTPSAATTASRADKILMGHQTLDTYKQDFIDTAKSMFPGITSQLDQGMTVADMASPYIDKMSSLLELNPSQLDVRTPMIRKALQGTQQVVAGNAKVPSVQPLWAFEQQVRADPRWAHTDNAHQQTASMLTSLGQQWGFA